MFRATIGSGTNTLQQLSSTEWVGVNSAFSQIIRWKRKPIWLPTAKTKLFRLSQRHRPPPDETIEILRLHNNYRTYRKSIKFYFMKVVEENKVAFDEEVLKRAEEDDYNRSMKINSKWNHVVKKIRDQRLSEEAVKQRIEVSKKLSLAKQKNESTLQKIEENVKKAKAESATFITPENIDQAIEEALANIVNYNEAIDIEGNKYRGNVVAAEKKVQQSIQQ